MLWTSLVAGSTSSLKLNALRSFANRPKTFGARSVSGLDPRQPRDVHPERKRHQPILRGQRHARTPDTFHLVQRSSDLHRRRRLARRGEQQQQNKFLRHQQIIARCPQESLDRDEPQRIGKPSSHPQRGGCRFRQLHLRTGRRRAGQHRRSRSQRYVE